MLSPDNVVYSVDSGQASAYEQHGYTRYSGPTIDESSIEAKFGGWAKKAAEGTVAASLGVVNQVPFLDAAADKVAPEFAQHLASATEQARAQYPTAYAVGSLGGALGTFGLAGKAAGAAGGALAAAGGTVGGAVAKAGQLAAESPLIAGAVKGAVGSAAFNVADQVDAAALEHALTPEGQEKLAFSLSQLGTATAAGGVIPFAFGALPAVLGRTARAADRAGDRTLVGAFLDDTGRKALADVGKGHVADTILKPLVDRGQGSKSVMQELGNKIHSLALDHENLLVTSRDTPATIDEARKVLRGATKALKSTPVGHDDLKPLADAVASHDALDAAKKTLDVAKRQAGSLGAGATDAQRAAAKAAVDRASAQVDVAQGGLLSLPKDIDYKETAEKLYKRINFKDPLRNDSYLELLKAGRRVAKGRDAIFERAGGAAGVAKFRATRAALSDHLAVAEAVKDVHLPDVKAALDKAKSSGAVAGALAALGVKGGGVAASAASGAGMALLYYSGLRGIAAGSRKVASYLVGADKNLANIIKAGLYTTSVPRVALHKYEFQAEASRVLAAQRDPATAYSAIHQGLLDKGMPEPVADRVAPRLHAMTQASAQALPKRQTSPDLATATQPDLHQQRTWLSEHRSRMDPTYALAYPTAQNMAAAKQHHPETIVRAQEAVMDALAKNPYLPIASRMWASRVLGRPAGGLTSPKFYQSLAQMRAKADAEAQQGGGDAGPPRQRGNGPSPVAQSEQSRLGELSTR